MAGIEHRSSRVVDQRPDVVHGRLLELAARLRDELPPIREGTEAASLLGITGSIGLEVADRGPGRIELRTTRGRIRGEAAVTLAPSAPDRTRLDAAILLRPEGFAANLMAGAALAARPQLRSQLIDGFERGLDDLVLDLAKPDGEWDARTWAPRGVTIER